MDFLDEWMTLLGFASLGMITGDSVIYLSDNK